MNTRKTLRTLLILAAAALPLVPLTAEAAQRPALITQPNSSEPVAPADLDKAFSQLPSHKFGQDQSCMDTIDQQIRALHGKPAETGALAARLAGLLNANSSVEARRYILRRLDRIATPQCIAAAAQQLNDPDVANLAAGVLQSLDSGASRAALRDALRSAKGASLVTAIETLGIMRDAPATPGLAKLLSDGDAPVRLAAATALEHIATRDALEAVNSALPRAKGELHGRLVDAALGCADKLADSDRDAALEVFMKFYTPDEPSFIRAAALRGLVRIKGQAATPLIVEALAAKDASLATAAAGFVRMVPGAGAAKAFADALPSLRPQVQVGVLQGLLDRNDKSDLPVFIKATGSSDLEVRLVAIRAIATLGGPDQVELLGNLAATTHGDEQQAARTALQTLPGDAVTAQMVALLTKAPPPQRVEIIRALPERRSPDAVAVLLKAAGDENAPVRLEAIRTLGELGSPDDTGKLLAMLGGDRGGAEQTALENAVASILHRLPADQRDKYAGNVVGQIQGATVPVQCSLVRIAARLETPQALVSVVQATRSQTKELADTAVRALSNCNDVAAMEPLLDLAKNSPSATYKVLALQGYIRLTGDSRLNAGQKVANYRTAWELARRPEEKRQVISGLGDIRSASSIKALMEAMDDAGVAEEASRAAIKVCKATRNQDVLRRQAMQKVVKVSQDEKTRAQARAVESSIP